MCSLYGLFGPNSLCKLTKSVYKAMPLWWRNQLAKPFFLPTNPCLVLALEISPVALETGSCSTRMLDFRHCLSGCQRVPEPTSNGDFVLHEIKPSTRRSWVRSYVILLQPWILKPWNQPELKSCPFNYVIRQKRYN